MLNFLIASQCFMLLITMLFMCSIYMWRYKPAFVLETDSKQILCAVQLAKGQSAHFTGDCNTRPPHQLQTFQMPSAVTNVYQLSKYRQA